MRLPDGRRFIICLPALMAFPNQLILFSRFRAEHLPPLMPFRSDYFSRVVLAHILQAAAEDLQTWSVCCLRLSMPWDARRFSISQLTRSLYIYETDRRCASCPSSLHGYHKPRHAFYVRCLCVGRNRLLTHAAIFRAVPSSRSCLSECIPLER
ncbi:hypothetical protein HYPSUDRAFT_466166 [Hypholoma sublateritium FD-334 SS-4]|uniref:Uncharacterized protein n=1 Tax=Hypholoma sublateritium (strain FD-334 SS-4) TaxID=945553 RepID=A0A0D2LC50_HYPSF|nr:hypothetical protein HYPSUDRAFT_466166 [Hypholoma sublateritium FD-334 SS-4]